MKCPFVWIPVLGLLLFVGCNQQPSVVPETALVQDSLFRPLQIPSLPPLLKNLPLLTDALALDVAPGREPLPELDSLAAAYYLQARTGAPVFPFMQMKLRGNRIVLWHSKMDYYATSLTDAYEPRAVLRLTDLVGEQKAFTYEPNQDSFLLRPDFALFVGNPAAGPAETVPGRGILLLEYAERGARNRPFRLDSTGSFRPFGPMATNLKQLLPFFGKPQSRLHLASMSDVTLRNPLPYADSRFYFLPNEAPKIVAGRLAPLSYNVYPVAMLQSPKPVYLLLVALRQVDAPAAPVRMRLASIDASGKLLSSIDFYLPDPGMATLPPSNTLDFSLKGGSTLFLELQPSDGDTPVRFLLNDKGVLQAETPADEAI